jgi:hypothetical protein
MREKLKIACEINLLFLLFSCTLIWYKGFAQPVTPVLSGNHLRFVLNLKEFSCILLLALKTHLALPFGRIAGWDCGLVDNLEGRQGSLSSASCPTGKAFGSPH